MDFRGYNNDSSFPQNNSSNANSIESSKIGSTCDGRFSWAVHGPLIVVCSFIIIFNSVVLALVRCKERLQTLTNIIIASLAASDLMSGLFGIPLLFGCSISIMTGQIAVCVSSTLFMRFTAVSTVLHFLLVACDRHIMITFPLRYQALVNRYRVRCALIVIWLTSTLVATVELSWFETKNIKEKLKKDKVYSIMFVTVFLSVPLLSMLGIYGNIIMVSMRHLLALRARRINFRDEANNTRSIVRDLRGSAILIFMLIVFAGCWLPFYLMVVQDYIGAKIISASSWRLCFVLFARFAPPVTNPVFGAFCKRDFRNELRTWRRSFQVSSVRRFSGSLFKKKSRKNINNSHAICTESVDGSANSSRNLISLRFAPMASPCQETYSILSFNITNL